MQKNKMAQSLWYQVLCQRTQGRELTPPKHTHTHTQLSPGRVEGFIGTASMSTEASSN